ncbi:hypothetical protein [Oerskovia paurometabola]|uniref:hypothetical protein n=1 Tax=Oerskovia paurometabola TaxID=162170 RepID=UPI00343214CF
MLERDRQPLPWQSTSWALSYNRRTLIEALKAQIRFSTANVNRGFIQVLSRHGTNLLPACFIAAHNTIQLHKWHTKKGLPEPWALLTGEAPDDRPLGRTTRSIRGRRWAPPSTRRTRTSTT